MEKKKRVFLAIVFLLFILLLGTIYYLYSSGAFDLSQPQANSTINSAEFGKNDSWDTVANKTDMIEQLDELQKKKEDNSVTFNDALKGNKLEDSYGAAEKKPKKEPDHNTRLQRRLQTEIAKDPVFEKPKPIAVTKSETPKEDDPDFEFAGFTVKRGEKQKEPAPETPMTVLKNLIPEESQAAGFVAQKTRIYTNAPLKITLSQDLNLPLYGIKVPKGTSVTALTNLNGGRVTGRIEGINVNGKIYKVYLRIYDLDGNEGLQVGDGKKEINSNVRSGIDNAVGSTMGRLGIGGQIAGGLFSSINRQTNRAEAVILEGYKLILRD